MVITAAQSSILTDTKNLYYKANKPMDVGIHQGKKE
jgi:hypothetical protein